MTDDLWTFCILIQKNNGFLFLFCGSVCDEVFVIGQVISINSSLTAEAPSGIRAQWWTLDMDSSADP